jgi:hypothetical protein
MVLGEHSLSLVQLVVDKQPSGRLWKEEDEDEDQTGEQELQLN